ncbi:MAG: hypothetical protein CVU91_12410 [Firmicutes bacterium HGW-Firmicutes-16]|nr:MAG: hypothetical protein CVU91_12410 [Firmicutes bacterium HGW-Firmicutes-16]
MKKRLLSILLTVCMVLTLLPGFTQPAMAAGEGTGNPANGAFILNTSGVNEINNADQLAYVAYQINNNIPDWRTASYKIINNIDLSSYPNWEPIGIGGKDVNWPEFKGTFDGGGYTISNLKQNREDGDFGLFGTISNWQAPGVVRNIVLTNVQITASNITNSTGIGALAGYNKGTIENCSVAGTISATSNGGYVYVGGLAGRHWGTVRNCYSTANVSVKVKQVLGTNDINCGGGIAGQSMGGVIDNCYSTGAVTLDSVDANSKVGGIAGYLFGGNISNCYWLSSNITVGIGGGTATNISSFSGTDTLASQVTIGGTSYSSLLGALNARVNELASTNLKTWTSSGSYPVFSTAWTPPTYTATVTVNKDGSAWTSGTPNIKLSTSSSTLTGAISGTISNGVYTFSGLANDTSYYLWEDGDTDSYVGQSVTKASNTVTLNYYTVTFRNDNNTSTLNTQTVLSGQNAIYGGETPTKAATAQYSYAFSKWVTTAGGAIEATLTNITAAKTVYASFTPTLLSYTITWKKDASNIIDTSTVAFGEMPTHSIPNNTGYTFSGWTPAIASVTGSATYTATWTLDTHNISYTLNGGTVASANPVNYTIESTAITLNNPTRAGFTFLGWTGSNGATAQTSVTIPTGSTGNKTYTANWKADKPASAPNDSIVTAKTDTSLTITTQAGYEYSVNGTSWYSGTGSYTFTDLAPKTAYNLVCRKAAVTTGDTFSASDASDALSVTTKTATAMAPVAPTIGTGTDKPTSNSITISTVAGSEYYISTSATADWSGTPNGYFKASVSGPHKFDSLSPATQYYIHVRVAETDNAMPSASASVMQYTLPTTPLASVVTVNYASETISFVNTYEVSTSAGFTTTIASGGTLTPGTTYYVRVKSASGAPASEAVSFTIPERPAAPTTITADKTKNSITITPVAGQEYKIGTGSWQDSGNFTGLSQNTDYTVSARVKAVSNGSISFASEVYSKTIKTKSDGSSGFSLPTISVSPTYAPSKTLNDINLPLGWDWSAPATVPTVTNSGYSAVYTPTDTATVDYSGVAGYAVDGNGKVTITRTVPLTVNCATPTAADFSYTAPAPLDYNATAKSASVTANGGISGMGTVTVKYYLDGTEILEPTNVGTYTVKINVVQGDNYAAATAVTHSAWTFTIAKVAQAPLSITEPPSVTYGHTFTLETAGGSGTGAVTWAVTPGGSATVVPVTQPGTGKIIAEVTINGVGETIITATHAADGNYLADVTDTYTFTPLKRLITVDAPSTTGGWTKIYDGKTDFDKSIITVGGITNKVGSDAVNVTVQSAAYNTADVGSGDKTLTIAYAIDGTNSENYLAPDNTVISTASITAATPTITLKTKTEAYTGKKIEIDAATVKGVTGGTTPDGAITYTYYTKDTCTDADKTSVDKSGAEAVGGAPKTAGTYYVKANIEDSGNYTAATSAAVTLTIYYPSSGENNSAAPVIVDGKTVDMGTSEVKDGTTTVKVDQNKMSEQLKNAKDSVVIPVTSKTDTAAAQLVVQNVEDMAKKGMTLTVQAEGVKYNLPAAAVDTAALLKGLDASDSAKVTFTVTMAELSKTAVTIKDGTLMVAPMQFTVTAEYNGKSVNVESFASYVHRDIELPSGVDPKTITTAVVVETNGSERHVPTEVYSKSGKWYAKINSMTNSTYALIQNSANFTDTTGKWYAAVVTEMASRKVISGIGENMFAGERAITRAEFAAIIVRALGLPTTGTSAFTDVAISAWYNGAVGTAFEYGIVSGVGNNKFNPDANITRQDAMVMVTRAAKLCGMDTTDGGAMGLAGFEDATKISSWAYDSAAFNVKNGLIKGDNGKISPSAAITRAETATVVLRLLQKAGLVDVRTAV